MMRLTLLAFLVASAHAFMMPTAPLRQPTARAVVLTEEEQLAVLSSAQDCAAGECSVDEVAGLISELKDTEKLLSARLDEVMNLVADLQKINKKKHRNAEEVRSFVKDMMRVFNTDKPIAFPAGFAGDVGDGPTTAYDALPPKPWKAH